MGIHQLIQIDPDINVGTGWAIITVLAGAISALAIYHSKRQKDWEKKFEKLSAEHKDEIVGLVKTLTQAYIENKNIIQGNTKSIEEQTRLYRDLRDKILKTIK